MPLYAPTYRIALDDLDHEHEVKVTPADQLRAETEGNRRGLVDPAHQSMLLTLLWLWAAARRVGLVPTEERFEPFVDRLVAWERVKPEEPADDEVRPTREAASSTPASPSAPDSPESTGSPASTTTPPSSPPPSDSSPVMSESVL